MRRILLLHRRWWFYAAPPLPAFAMVDLGGGGWGVDDTGAVAPDGWAVDLGGGGFGADDAASSGLDVSIVGGAVLVTT